MNTEEYFFTSPLYPVKNLYNWGNITQLHMHSSEVMLKYVNIIVYHIQSSQLLKRNYLMILGAVVRENYIYSLYNSRMPQPTKTCYD